MPAAAVTPKRAAWSDERLVAACCKGDQQAWTALLEKYKNLIYSVPIKLGMYDEAADIFQSVCLDLLHHLKELREPKALPKWLMQVSYHKCLQARRRADRHVELGEEHDTASTDEPLPEELISALQRDQAVRGAVASLSERCGRMVRMLFFEDPPRPYDEVARELGLATGSIGFIRGRCLEKLRKQLEQMGVE